MNCYLNRESSRDRKEWFPERNKKMNSNWKWLRKKKEMFMSYKLVWENKNPFLSKFITFAGRQGKSISTTAEISANWKQIILLPTQVTRLTNFSWTILSSFKEPPTIWESTITDNSITFSQYHKKQFIAVFLTQRSSLFFTLLCFLSGIWPKINLFYKCLANGQLAGPTLLKLFWPRKTNSISSMSV